METYLVTGAIATAIAAAPFAIPAAAEAARAAGASAQATQEASRHQASAALLQPAADAGKSYAPDTQVLAQARWRAPGGAPLTGQVLAPAGAAKGSPVRVWTDTTGHLAAPPLTDGQIASQADLAGAAAGVALAVLLLGETAVIQQAMNRRRMAAWDAEWSATEPTWNHQR
jgi:hypothetical protein